jgi:hypothetical protein
LCNTMDTSTNLRWKSGRRFAAFEVWKYVIYVDTLQFGFWPEMNRK